MFFFYFLIVFISQTTINLTGDKNFLNIGLPMNEITHIDAKNFRVRKNEFLNKL
jgi:hypothetical protein